jgi:hypothetical protein
MKLFHSFAFTYAMAANPLLAYAQEYSRFVVTAGHIGLQAGADAPININLSDILVA